MTLYRLHRPQSFAALLGQDQASSLLQGSLMHDQIGHAYLFTGPRGTGKTTSARLFAKAVCCENLVKDSESGKAEACGTCNSCIAIANEAATDLVEIDAASNRGIEDIRLLREQAQFFPVALKYRVYILDECHMLTNEAANALLKTLEEPPAHAIFILATTELHKVPLTIRSRCQLVRFKRGSIEAISSKLLAIAKLQKLSLKSDVATLIASHADGGFRDAETILEQLSLLETTITGSMVEELLGILPAQQYEKLIDGIVLQDISSITSSVEVIRAQNDVLRPSAITQMLIDRLRSKAIDKPHVRVAMQLLVESLILQKASPSPLLPLETALLQCASLDIAKNSQPREQPRMVLDRSEAPTKTIAQTVLAPEPVKESSAPVIEIREREPIAHKSDVRRAWRDLGEVLMNIDLPLAHLVNTTLVHSVEGSLVTIHAKYRFHVDKLNQKSVKEKINDALTKLTGEKWQITVELNASMPDRKPKKAISDGLSTTSAEEIFTTNA